MPDSARSSVHLDVAPGANRSGLPVGPDRPFRILILSDFSGRANRGVSSALRDRAPVRIDRDNVDDVLAGMHPQLRLPGLNLDFRDLDDFHPDHIYRATATFQQFAAERGRLPQTQTAPARKAPAGSKTSGRGLLDEMLEESGEDPPATEDAGDLATFLKKVTAPYLVPRQDPRQKVQEAHSDSAAAAAMREVLHHPDFQRLEAAWRAVFMLIRGLDTDGELELHLFDATLDELAADLPATRELLVSPQRPWASIVGDYTFQQSDTYAKVLGLLGHMASAAGAPFIAEAAPPAEAPGAGWSALRQSPEARWIGLALPRFLLRLPYGPDTSPIETFDFQEMPVSVHEQYLWGNPAYCCAYMLAQSFLADGWNMRPGSHRQIDGIPLHIYTVNGEREMKPCAEILMTEKDADFLMEHGIMPLASMKNQDAVLLVRFQSIADPLAALSGPWST